MQTLTIAFGVLAVIVLGAAAFLETMSRGRSGENTASAPEPKFRPAGFPSPAERSFFGVLRQAVGTEFHVFAKVRLADIVTPQKTRSRSAWQSAFNRISSKHVDFLLCETAGLSPVAVIELDDKSHSTFEAGFRDRCVDLTPLYEVRSTQLRENPRLGPSLIAAVRWRRGAARVRRARAPMTPPAGSR